MTTESKADQEATTGSGHLKRGIMRELIKEAFLLGFMVTRNGFNAECVIRDLAPTTIRADCGQTDEEFKKWISEIEEFEVLLKEVLARLEESEGEHCEHGKGLNDYCEPCGRIDGN